MSTAYQKYAIYRLRAFSRLVSAFGKEQIPVLHFTDLDRENTVLSPSLRLRRTFETFQHDLPNGPGGATTFWMSCPHVMQAHPTAIDGSCPHLTIPPGLTDLQKAQARIKEQHGVLCKAEEHTRQVHSLLQLSLPCIAYGS